MAICIHSGRLFVGNAVVSVAGPRSTKAVSAFPLRKPRCQKPVANASDYNRSRSVQQIGLRARLGDRPFDLYDTDKRCARVSFPNGHVLNSDTETCPNLKRFSQRALLRFATRLPCAGVSLFPAIPSIICPNRCCSWYDLCYITRWIGVKKVS